MLDQVRHDEVASFQSPSWNPGGGLVKFGVFSKLSPKSYKVDIVDYASASPRFRDIIQQEYEVIYRPKKSREAMIKVLFFGSIADRVGECYS